MNRREFLGAAGFAAAQRKLYWSLDQPVITVREPYLQNVRRDRVSVMWATQFSGTGYVEYSLDGANFKRVLAQGRTFSSAETGLQGSFTQFTGVIPRLTPNTTYFYRCVVNADIVGAPSRFRTAAVGPSDFRFAAIGDTGMGTPEQLRVATILAQEDAALLLHLGDMAYMRGSFEDFQRNHFDVYRQTLSHTPLFPAPGNHEYETPNASAYIALHHLPAETVASAERGRYYSFDWGNVHFVSLDANADRSVSGLRRAISGTGDMLNWLDRDLRSTRQFWKVVYFHQPPFSGGINGSDPVEGEVRRFIVPILDANCVQLVINGHEHNYQRTFTLKQEKAVSEGTGTVYVTAGGGGASLYTLPSTLPQTAVQRFSHHFVRVDVSAGQMLLTAVSDSGAELDKFTITPQPVFADPSRAVSFSGDPVAGALIYVRGWNLALQESALQQAPAESLLGTSLMLGDRVVPLFYASPTQVVGQLPFDLLPGSVCQIRMPNGTAACSL